MSGRGSSGLSLRAASGHDPCTSRNSADSLVSLFYYMLMFRAVRQIQYTQTEIGGHSFMDCIPTARMNLDLLPPGHVYNSHMRTSKHARPAKCSTDTALRDTQDLKARGVFIRNPDGGRGTSYRLPNRIPGQVINKNGSSRRSGLSQQNFSVLTVIHALLLQFGTTIPRFPEDDMIVFRA